MSKSKQKYIILGIILLLFILTIFFKRTSTSIKGVSLDSSGNFIEIDLGRYNENKIYDKYPVYIISNNSDFNLLRVFGVEVKYPSSLTLEAFSKNKLIAFTDKSRKLILTIQNIKNEDKKTVKNFLEDINESSNNEIPDKSDKSDIHQEVKGNKIIEIGKTKDKSLSFLNIYEIGDNIKFLSLNDLNNTENIDSIINTMKDSYRLN